MTPKADAQPTDPEPDWADEIDKFLAGTVSFLLRFVRTCWIFGACPWRAPRYLRSDKTSFVRPYPYLFVSALLISGAAVLSLAGGSADPDPIVSLAYGAVDYFDAAGMALAVGLAIMQVVVALLVGGLLALMRVPLTRDDAIRWVAYTLGTQWLTLGVFFLLRRIVGPAFFFVERAGEIFIWVQPAWILWWALPKAPVTRRLVLARLAVTAVAALLTAATIGGNAVPQLVDSVKRPLRLAVAGYKVDQDGDDHVLRMDLIVTNTSGRVVFMQYRASLATWPDLGLALPLTWDVAPDAPPEIALETGDTYHMRNAHVRVPPEAFDQSLVAVRALALVFQNRGQGVATEWASPDPNMPADNARMFERLGARRIAR